MSATHTSVSIIKTPQGQKTSTSARHVPLHRDTIQWHVCKLIGLCYVTSVITRQSDTKIKAVVEFILLLDIKHVTREIEFHSHTKAI